MASNAARAAEIGLSLALLLSAARRLTSLPRRQARSVAAFDRQISLSQVGTIAVRDLNGLDATGAPLFLRARSASDRFALFVVRGSDSKVECAFWDTVAARLKDDGSHTRLVGICNGPGCIGIPPKAHSFPVLTFADESLMTRASVLNTARAALVIDGAGRVVKFFRWRGRSPSFVSRRIAGTRRAH